MSIKRRRRYHSIVKRRASRRPRWYRRRRARRIEVVVELEGILFCREGSSVSGRACFDHAERGKVGGGHAMGTGEGPVPGACACACACACARACGAGVWRLVIPVHTVVQTLVWLWPRLLLVATLAAPVQWLKSTSSLTSSASTSVPAISPVLPPAFLLITLSIPIPIPILLCVGAVPWRRRCGR